MCLHNALKECMPDLYVYSVDEWQYLQILSLDGEIWNSLPDARILPKSFQSPMKSSIEWYVR